MSFNYFRSYLPSQTPVPQASTSGASAASGTSQGPQPGPSSASAGPVASTSAPAPRISPSAAHSACARAAGIADYTYSPFQTSSLTIPPRAFDDDGKPIHLLENYTPQDEMELYVEHNFVRRRPLAIVHEFTVEEVTFYANLTVKNRCGVANCDGHLIYGVVVKHNLPVEFLRHDTGEVAKYWPYVSKACLPYRTPMDREQLIGGIRWNTLTPREPHVKGISNSCMIDGWLTDIKLRTLDVKTCLGCWFIHKSGPGLKIEKALRTISKFILTCAAPVPDASGRNQIVKELTHDQDLFVKTIWLQEKLFNFDSSLYKYRRGGEMFQNKLVDLLHPSADPGESEVVTRMSMHK